MSFMGIDIGTTGAKAVVFNGDGKIISSAYREYSMQSPRPGWLELDSNLVSCLVREIIAEAARGAGKDSVQGLAVSAIGEGITAVGPDRKPLHNTFISMCTRSRVQTETWRQAFGKERTHQITGHPLHPQFCLTKLLWLKQNHPDIFEKTWKFLGWEDFVYAMLGVEPVVDYSLASRTLLFDIVKLAWSEEILDAAGIPQSKLPCVAASGQVIGRIPREVCGELGLSDTAVAVTGGFDQACAALGAGVVFPGMAADGLGTVECITVGLGRPNLGKEMLANSYPCFPHCLHGMYATLAFSYSGGNLLRWYRDNFAKSEVEQAQKTGRNAYELILAELPVHVGGPLVLPHFVGTGTPWADPLSRGAILGLTLNTTGPQILRSLLESVVFELKLNLDCLDGCGIRVDQLRATGGGARSPAWMQMKADVTGLEVTSMAVSEAGALACAMLTATALERFRDLGDAAASWVKAGRTYTPEPGAASRYKERYDLYRELYAALRPLNHRLHALDEGAGTG